MSDVINGVPRELLERVCSKPKACSSIIEVNRWSIDQKLALGELRALLAEQPQASVCETMGRPKAECGCPDCGSSLIEWPQASAAQSAPAGEQPAPYGWVAAGQFFTAREDAADAAGKTPCVEVYSRPQVLAILDRSAERQALAEHLARLLKQSGDEVRELKSAPSGEREAAVEAAYAAVVEGGWSSVKEMGVEMFQAGAAWQRTQSAGVPDTSELQRVIYNADYNAKRMLDADSFWLSEIATIRVEFERFMRSLAAAPAQPAAQREQQLCPVCDGKGEIHHPHAHDEYRCESCDGCGTVEKAAAQDQGEVQRLPSGWRVFLTTSSVVREGDRWEVYGPNGGGVVSTHDVKDWAVRQLLDALAASTGQEGE